MYIWLSGIPWNTANLGLPVFQGFPDNQINGIFYESRYCKDHGNQGPDNQGLAVYVANLLRDLSPDVVVDNKFLNW